VNAPEAQTEIDTCASKTHMYGDALLSIVRQAVPALGKLTE
jgi:hypothetical protein